MFLYTIVLNDYYRNIIEDFYYTLTTIGLYFYEVL